MGRKAKDYVGEEKGGWVCIARTKIHEVPYIVAERLVDGNKVTANIRLNNWITGRVPSSRNPKGYAKNYLVVYLDTMAAEVVKGVNMVPVENFVDTTRPCVAYRAIALAKVNELTILYTSPSAQQMQIVMAKALAGVTTPEAPPTLLQQATLTLPQGVTPDPAKPWEAASLLEAAKLLEDDEPLVTLKEALPPARPIRDELDEGISLLTDKMLREGTMPEHGIPQYKSIVHRAADSKLYAAEVEFELARLKAENPLNPPERLPVSHRVPPLPPEELKNFRHTLALTHPEEDAALDEVFAFYEQLRQLVRERDSQPGKSPLALAAGL